MAGIAATSRGLRLRAFAYAEPAFAGEEDRDCYDVAFFVSWARVASSGMLHALPDHPSLARTLDAVVKFLGEMGCSATRRRLFDRRFRPTGVGWLPVSRWHGALVAEGGTPEAVAGMSRSLCRRGGGWRSEPCRWSPAAEAVVRRGGGLTPRLRSRRHRRFLREKEIARCRRIHTRSKPVYVANITLLVRSVSPFHEGMENIESCPKHGARKQVDAMCRALTLSVCFQPVADTYQIAFRHYPCMTEVNLLRQRTGRACERKRLSRRT